MRAEKLCQELTLKQIQLLRMQENPKGKPVAQKRAITGKEKKPSIQERLEINKRIF